MSSRENIFASQRKAYDSCLQKLDNLFQLKISPLNSNGSLLSDEEYAKQKTELIKEKTQLEEILNDTEGRVQKWLESGEKIFNFARYARYWFKNGSSQEKAQILQSLGSNLTLEDKKLMIQLQTPLTAIGQIVAEVPEAKEGFELKKSGLNEAKLESIYSKNPIVLGAVNKVRIWITRNYLDFFVPDLRKKTFNEQGI